MNHRLFVAIRLTSAVVLAGCVAIFSLGILIHPKILDWDSRRGLLSAMQYEQSLVPNIVQLASADPHNLLQTHFEPEAWRSPGYQAIPWLFRQFGMSWGHAVRASILLFFFMGVVAWCACYRLVVKDTWAVVGFALALMLSPIMVDSLKVYDSGDLLLFGFVPVLILLNILTLRQRSKLAAHAFAAAGGLLSTTIFFFKYSGIFIGIGVGVAWLLICFFQREHRRIFISWLIGAVSGIAAILATGYPWGPTPTSSIGAGIKWRDGILAFGAWPLSMTDSAESISRIGTFAGISEFEMRTVWCPAMGLVFCGILVWLLRREMTDTFMAFRGAVKRCSLDAWWPHMLMTIPFLTDTLSYAAIIFCGGSVEVCARLARLSGLLAFPILFVMVWRYALASTPAVRVVCMALLALFIASGPFMGTLRVARLAVSIPSAYRSATEQSLGIRIEGVGSNLREQAEFYQELRTHMPSTETVLFVTAPEHLLEIPRQRHILVYVMEQYNSPEQLAALRFSGRPLYGVAMLLPQELEKDGRAVALQKAFADVREWKSVRFRSDPRWTLWLSPPMKGSTTVSTK